MALPDIIAKIHADAEAEASRIEAAAADEARGILERAKAAARDVAERAASDAERAEQKAHGRIVSAATHEAKFTTQSVRVALIADVFTEAERMLQALDAAAYAAFVTTAAGSLAEKVGTVTVASEREDETLALLEKAGVKTSGATSAPLLGGFVLETNAAVYDHSFASLLAHARETNASAVAQELFTT